MSVPQENNSIQDRDYESWDHLLGLLTKPVPYAVSTAVTLTKMERSHQHANRVPQVLREGLQKQQSPAQRVVLADSLRSALLQCGLPPRLCGRHSGAKILVCLEREMFGEFIPEALVGAPSGGEVGDQG